MSSGIKQLIGMRFEAKQEAILTHEPIGEQDWVIIDHGYIVKNLRIAPKVNEKKPNKNDQSKFHLNFKQFNDNSAPYKVTTQKLDGVTVTSKGNPSKNKVYYYKTESTKADLPLYPDTPEESVDCSEEHSSRINATSAIPAPETLMSPATEPPSTLTSKKTAPASATAPTKAVLSPAATKPTASELVEDVRTSERCWNPSNKPVKIRSALRQLDVASKSWRNVEDTARGFKDFQNQLPGGFKHRAKLNIQRFTPSKNNSSWLMTIAYDKKQLVAAKFIPKSEAAQRLYTTQILNQAKVAWQQEKQLDYYESACQYLTKSDPKRHRYLLEHLDSQLFSQGNIQYYSFNPNDPECANVHFKSRLTKKHKTLTLKLLTVATDADPHTTFENQLKCGPSYHNLREFLTHHKGTAADPHMHHVLDDLIATLRLNLSRSFLESEECRIMCAKVKLDQINFAELCGLVSTPPAD
ncbi:hypothetical protein SOPP22_06040 [Shewanella sp. OPT22]|nr:hypothetical protein SOPP22_06040 [Shewanella sp. OPT22]